MNFGRTLVHHLLLLSYNTTLIKMCSETKPLETQHPWGILGNSMVECGSVGDLLSDACCSHLWFYRTLWYGSGSPVAWRGLPILQSHFFWGHLLPLGHHCALSGSSQSQGHPTSSRCCGLFRSADAGPPDHFIYHWVLLPLPLSLIHSTTTWCSKKAADNTQSQLNSALQTTCLKRNEWISLQVCWSSEANVRKRPAARNDVQHVHGTSDFHFHHCSWIDSSLTYYCT